MRDVFVKSVRVFIQYIKVHALCPFVTTSNIALTHFCAIKSLRGSQRMRVIVICLVVCWMLVASIAADNIINRMLRQVLPSTVVGIGYDELSGDFASNAIGDLLDDSNDNNPVRKESMHADSSNSVPNSDTSSGWNPFSWFAPKKRSIPYNPDTDLQTCEIAARHGYQCEAHVVITDDGYLLTMHRLPCKRIGCEHLGRRGSGQPVFLQHGLLSSSSDWLLSGPNKALAFILADAGYDVWLGNARGNTYSKRHISLRHKDSEFWDFSWHEMAYFDVPAEIDYLYKIRAMENPSANNSTQPNYNLIYVGHSMGTTMAFAMLSLRPDYNVKIQAGIALAPVAFMSKVRSPIRLLAPFAKKIHRLIKYLGINEFLPQNQLVKILAKYGCEMTDAERYICENIIFVLCGFDKTQFNQTLMPVVLGHTPAGTSTKTIVHYAQEIHEKGNFQFFDYGSKTNLEKYGQDTPPQYDMDKITAPFALIYAQNDWLAGPEDVALLFDKMHRSSIGLFKVPFDNFNHVDFLFGNDAPALVYTKVLEVMSRFL